MTGWQQWRKFLAEGRFQIRLFSLCFSWLHFRRYFILPLLIVTVFPPEDDQEEMALSKFLSCLDQISRVLCCTFVEVFNFKVSHINLNLQTLCFAIEFDLLYHFSFSPKWLSFSFWVLWACIEICGLSERKAQLQSYKCQQTIFVSSMFSPFAK